MHTLSLTYPDDLLVTSGKAPKALEEELAFLLAAKLFEVRRLSLGKAAEFCSMSKLRFMTFFPNYISVLLRHPWYGWR